MTNRLRLVCASAGLLAPLVAFSAAPVAVVEDVIGSVPGIEFMDYVSAGQMIELGPQDTIVLSYLKSCVRETITGSTVIVLEGQSLVQRGSVKRSRVGCDSERMQLGSSQAEQSAGAVFRGVPRSPAQAEPRRLTLHGRSPIVEIDARRGPLLIERLDASAARIEVAIDAATLVRGRFIDLARAGIALTPGASYLARSGASTVEFSIATDAQSGATPIIGRLLRFD